MVRRMVEMEEGEESGCSEVRYLQGDCALYSKES